MGKKPPATGENQKTGPYLETTNAASPGSFMIRSISAIRRFSMSSLTWRKFRRMIPVSTFLIIGRGFSNQWHLWATAPDHAGRVLCNSLPKEVIQQLGGLARRSWSMDGILQQPVTAQRKVLPRQNAHGNFQRNCYLSETEDAGPSSPSSLSISWPYKTKKSLVVRLSSDYYIWFHYYTISSNLPTWIHKYGQKAIFV